MQEADLRSRLRYIFQTDDIPVDLALLGMEENGIVMFQSDGSVSITAMGNKLRRMAARLPAMTILRGKVIVDNGRLTGNTADGRWLSRRIAPGVLARPGC